MIRGTVNLSLEVAVRALLAPSIIASRWLLPAGGYGKPDSDAPRVRRSPLVAAKIVLDEFFFLTGIL